MKEHGTLIERIQGEYREMPGLSLTEAQAGRMWGLDRSATVQVLGHLVSLNFLRLTRNGMFVRHHG